MLFDTVYDFDLYSITPEIRVNQDWKKSLNIANADTKIVSKVMVQRTINPNLYKEIITGILIPVYRTTLKFGITHSYHGDPYYIFPKTPVFIKINDKFSYMEYSSDIVIAEAEDVKKYIQEHASNVEAFKEELISLFNAAEEYYENASSKNDYSDEKMVKTLLKNLKK